MKEPEIIINGTRLSVAECLTVRVAIFSLLSELMKNGLGTDPTGIDICKGYLRCCNTITGIMLMNTDKLAVENKGT